LVPNAAKLLYQPVPADKKGPAGEIQQSSRRRKEVTNRLEYQTSKSTRHRNCRAKGLPARDDHPSFTSKTKKRKTEEKVAGRVAISTKR